MYSKPWLSPIFRRSSGENLTGNLHQPCCLVCIFNSSLFICKDIDDYLSFVFCAKLQHLYVRVEDASMHHVDDLRLAGIYVCMTLQWPQAYASAGEQAL